MIKQYFKFAIMKFDDASYDCRGWHFEQNYGYITGIGMASPRCESSYAGLDDASVQTLHHIHYIYSLVSENVSSYEL